MSLFRRKPRGKSSKTRSSAAELASAMFPGPQPVPVHARPAAPGRRRARHHGYTAGRTRQPMFRVS